MKDFRHKLWLNIMEDLGPPEGCQLPGYLICIYLILFPLHGLSGLLSNRVGLDLYRMVWTIHGEKISDRLFVRYAVPEGRIIRIIRCNGILTFQDMTAELEGRG